MSFEHKPPLQQNQGPGDTGSGSLMLWTLGGLVAGVLVIAGALVFSLIRPEPDAGESGSVDSSAEVAAPAPVTTSEPLAGTSRPTPSPGGVGAPTPDTSNPAPVVFGAPVPTPTPEPGFKVYNLVPTPADAGWVVSDEDEGNHLGDSYLYAGFYEGQVFNAAFRFDLSALPRGAPIRQGFIRLTGLRDDRLAVQNDQPAGTGVWSLRMLTPDIDTEWRRLDFQTLFNASVEQTLNPILSARDLGVGRVNTFKLSSGQLQLIEQRVIALEKPSLAFRVEGPLVGPDNLFAWDTGTGSQSRGSPIVLTLYVGEPPATPPPYDFVVVTSTPTPENVMTAAAMVLQVTEDARKYGTATPVPPNMVTATPYPGNLVYVPTPTPANTATAEILAQVATAVALTTGTPTPMPANAVTATPTATPTETPTPQPPPPIQYVLITSTPTPESVFAAATMSAQATALANAVGTPTPLPTNWVTPVVVTPTPTPRNAATAQAIASLATAIAVTTGTPTLTPGNLVTATPTPVYQIVPLTVTPIATVDAPPPQPVPPQLVGKILFLSDRESGAAPSPGGQSTGLTVYVYDPSTGELGRLTNSWPYQLAVDRDQLSADKLQRTYVKQLLWTTVRDKAGDLQPVVRYTIHAFDSRYNQEVILFAPGAGDAWDPVWSPTAARIAFVSNESKDDEIWTVNADGSDPVRLTTPNEEYNAREIGKDTFIPEQNGHPSWSPDGSQIVFWSNRTGNKQLWIMNADGSDQRLLMGWDNWTPYNDWNPVWVKYQD